MYVFNRTKREMRIAKVCPLFKYIFCVNDNNNDVSLMKSITALSKEPSTHTLINKKVNWVCGSRAYESLIYRQLTAIILHRYVNVYICDHYGSNEWRPCIPIQ